jgi:monothiol glutaredoxin
MKTVFDWKTYPQLYIQGSLVGGIDVMEELAQEGELAEMFPAGTIASDE